MKKSFVLLPVLFSLVVSQAADWPQWRGPNRDDHSADKGLKKEWPAGGPKRVWMFEDAGLGYSGFAIVGGRLFTMGVRDDIEQVICVDAGTGKEIWKAELGGRLSNNWGDGPRATPTVDGDRVYAMSGKGLLVCVSAKDGQPSWKVDLTKDLGGSVPGWGYTESPLVDGDKVVCTPGGKKGTMAALDKMTGKVIRQSADLTEGAQYASPLVVEFGGKRQYLNRSMKKIFGVAATDGKVLWQADFPGATAVIPTLIYSDGRVYATAGYGAGCLQLKLNASGNPEVGYQNGLMVNHHGGVILVDGKLYGHSDSGGWTCQDFKTGAKVWQDGKLGKGCCTFADGHLICVAEENGTVAWVDASPAGWKEHGRFKLDPQTTKRKKDGRIWTHPVVVNGRLYLRDQDLIYCYDVKE